MLSVIFSGMYMCFRFWRPHCHFRLSIIVAIALRQLHRAHLVENPRFAVGISILSVIVLDILTLPVSAATLISGCTSAPHLFGETSFEFAVVENFDVIARITIIHTLKRVNPI